MDRFDRARNGAVPPFTESFPRSSLSVYPADTNQVLQMFEQNKIDIAFCVEPKTDPSLVFEHLFWDELLFLVAPRHPWAIEGRANRTELSKQNLILYTSNSYTYRLIEEYFGDDEIHLKSGMEMGNIDAMKELVKLGLGIAILPEWVAARELAEQSLVTVPLGKRKLRRNWGILRRANADTYTIQKFISICRTTSSSLLNPLPEPRANGAVHALAGQSN